MSTDAGSRDLIQRVLVHASLDEWTRLQINSRIRHHLVNKIKCVLVAWMTWSDPITCWNATFKSNCRVS